jgi:hypothetical protein
MNDVGEADEVHEEPLQETIVDFLEGVPPNQFVHISDLVEYKYVAAVGGRAGILRTPEIQLHCTSDSCNGVRFFRCVTTNEIRLTTDFVFKYLTYRCSNCQKSSKTFSLAVKIDGEDQVSGDAYKFGEIPIFGPPTPSRLIKLIGPDRDEFLKGRRCENQGLGVGAFIYYRRVVENQKNRIINEIIRVSQKLAVPTEKIDILKGALTETQFSKALEMAKDAIPESLLINGHSPIQLLHSALSEGVHALSDAKCLELASSVRVVLGELSERLSQALKDEVELTRALSTLMNFKK